jgi:hypothetical protein
MFKNLLARLNTFSTMKLIWLCILIGLGFVVGGILIASIGGVAMQIGGFFFPLGFLCWGLTGVPMIIRRELPWLITVRGWPAVFEGVVLVIAGILSSVILWIVILGGN